MCFDCFDFILKRARFGKLFEREKVEKSVGPRHLIGQTI
jgi:hypothetical protein